MKTAMQELIDEIKEAVPYFKMDIYQPNFNKALEKEKEQIIEAGNACGLKAVLYKDEVEKMSVDELNTEIDKNGMTFGEEYYNQTFKPETI